MVEVIERNREFSLGRAESTSKSSDCKQYVQDTSLTALPPELKREAMNRQVWYFLRAIPDSTMKEISKGTGIKINTLTWRMKDLRDEGSVIESYRDSEIHWRIKSKELLRGR